MPYKFNKLQKAWLSALESGRYCQGKDRLATRNIKQKTVEYCCLGVACVVARKNGIKLDKKCTITVGSIPVTTFDGEKFYLPEKVRVALKLNCRRGSNKKTGDSLSQLNDKGKTHEEIAAIIRANPEHYFTK